MPLITFRPEHSKLHESYEQPAPSSTVVPEWYKKMPVLIEGHKEHGIAFNEVGDAASNTTLKGCSPFLDALTSGYVYKTVVDIEVKKHNGNVLLRWRTPDELILSHDPIQTPGFPKPLEGSIETIFKFQNIFHIETPKGYSCLFTHPLNRFDLPFRTMSGVVDTDMYPNTVHFPFTLVDIDEDVYIIEKGTPVVQIIPFKRENWVSKNEPYDELRTQQGRYDLFSKIVKVYKNKYWQKKSYS